MKITTKLVAQIKKNNDEGHGHSWGYGKSAEIEAINMALWSDSSGETLSLSEIVEKAISYLKATKTVKYSKSERYSEEF